MWVPGDVDVLARDARAHLHRGVQPQDLLDGIGPQLGPGGEGLEMLRRIEQHPNPVAQQVNCGFEAGRQHETRECLQLVGVEAGTCVGGLDDLAHQIVAGVAAQLLQVFGQPAVEAGNALIDLLVLLPRQPDVEAGRTHLAEVQDAWPVFVGDARVCRR